MVKKDDSSLSVSMWIDDVKRFPKFKMTRLSYFVAEVDENVENWNLLLKQTNIQVLIYGLTVAICQPAGKNQIYASADDLDDLFKRLEEESSFTIETPDLWLPNEVFPKQPRPARGEVYRVGQKLFGAALRFLSGRTTDSEFIIACRKLMEKAVHSPVETKALQAWSQHQIDTAKRIYSENAGKKKAPYLKVLSD